MHDRLDLEFVRRQFPAFAQPSLDGQAFFENAGGTYACGAVIERLQNYYSAYKVQPYYDYAASQAAGKQMDDGYRRIAGLLNAAAGDVFFGPSTSANTYTLAHAALGFLHNGDEIIVTNQDHEANSGAWRRLAEHGIRIREWRVDPQDGVLHSDDLAALLGERTRIVTFPHCSNIVGQINPVREIASMIHDAGAIAVVDGVSYAGHGFPDVQQLDADVYLFSMYKTYGPHQGVMYMRPGVSSRLSNQGHYFNASSAGLRVNPAGPDHAQIAAAQGVADYIDAVHAHHAPAHLPPQHAARAVHDLFRQAENSLLKVLLGYLSHHPKVRIIGPRNAGADRAPTVSIIAHDVSPSVLLEKLAERGIMSGAGHFYAPRLLEAMGLDSNIGVNRFSFVHYTSEDDIVQLVDALDDIL